MERKGNKPQFKQTNTVNQHREWYYAILKTKLNLNIMEFTYEFTLFTSM